MPYTLASLAAEQEKLLLDRFDYDFAWTLGQAIRALASIEQAPVAIQVSHGLSAVFTTLLPGATVDNLDWTARKRAVAHRFHKSSLAIRLEAEAGKYDFNQRFRLPEEAYVASGGGIPLILKQGTLVGTVAVSGLPDAEDHRLIVEALHSLLGGTGHPGSS
jgi:uncharacterized protein (UPF0303 family)